MSDSVRLALGFFSFEYACHDGSQFGFAFRGDFQDLRDLDRFERFRETHVGNAGKSQDAHFRMDRDEDFRDGGHPDGIGSDEPQKSVFGPCFQVGTRDGYINAFVRGEIFTSRDFECGIKIAKFAVE